LILQNCVNLDIDLMSNTHGTPLHLASKMGINKVILKMIMSNANILLKNNQGLVPKQITKNQKVIFLIEKYEKIH
jgi:hypothetical protein